MIVSPYGLRKSVFSMLEISVASCEKAKLDIQRAIGILCDFQHETNFISLK